MALKPVLSATEECRKFDALKGTGFSPYGKLNIKIVGFSPRGKLGHLFRVSLTSHFEQTGRENHSRAYPLLSGVNRITNPCVPM